MAMEEELDEFEVLWPEYVTCYTHASYADDHHEPPPPPSSLMPRPGQRWSARSRPVDVPCRGAVLLRCRWKDGGEAEGVNVDGDGDGKKNIVVPPHLLVASSSSGTRRPDGETAATSTPTAASLRSGRQRKRARDLRHLRNSVLRMTGFIEG